MKSNPISFVGTILIVLFCNYTQAQSFGTFASAVYISDCNQSNFFNTTGNAVDLIGPAGNVFEGANLGIHTQNSGTLILRGAQVKTFKNPASSNVCAAQMFYRVYLVSGVPGSFNSIDLPFLENCNVPSSLFPSGGPCQAGDQKWERVIANGTTVPFAPVNLTTFAPGNYVLEVYYDVSGSFTSTLLCNDLVTLNNSGNNYKAFFSVQSLNLSSTNPSSCFGNGGSITIGGLVPGATYQLRYTDDGVNVGPTAYVANGAGQLIVTGLNAGTYANFRLTINGCTTNLFTGVILSDPIFVPTFSFIACFCAGKTAPILPTTSDNGITGTWSPSPVDNQNTADYTFTPAAGQCGLATIITVNVIPRATPTFTFGTSLIICGSGAVPALPTTSTNGITGTWTPAVVDNLNSGSYAFTPNPGQCATGTTFTVTINPNITPTFSFGTSLSMCAGASAPALPTTSDNGINGTWSPSIVNNLSSATYTFTPNAGQCATTTTLTVTVNPSSTATFSFGNSLTICAGGVVPILPTISDNGINGTWSPSVVDNQNSDTYTFTASAGCVMPFIFTVTVNSNITPTFSFGTSLSICAGGAVPALPTTATNGITGTWSPLVVDDQNSGTYTFTPGAGQCATTATFTVTVNPNVTPTFSFGTSLTICAGGTVPTLPTTSTNGITGTWSPLVVDNQNSATYTFTPDAGQCVLPAAVTFTVTVTPNIMPTFSFGNSLIICAGDAVPALPTTSDNGIIGTWSPSVVNDQASAIYVFTPAPGQCVTPFSFTVTVNAIVVPTFSFGIFQSICIGTAVPVLPTTSDNGITGTWSPSVVDNMTNGTYTFTRDAGQCASNATFTLDVNAVPSVTGRTDTTVYHGAVVPVFSFVPSPGAVINWTNSNPSIGLVASGTGNVSSFVAVNLGNVPVTGTITIAPSIGGCSGSVQSYIVTVLPLHKDVFVPNVFSPNGDGKNDVLFVYGSYISKVEMHIFNQWGQQVALINNQTQGWDGKHKGNPQPVGVYMYVLRAVMTYGRTIDLKGSVTLVR